MKKSMLVIMGITITALLALSGCSPKVGKGMTVTLDYKGSFSDGTVFDTSEGKEPLEFDFGTSQIIPGLESEMAGLKKGDKKTITVPAAEAYGEYTEDALIEWPLERVPEEYRNVTVGTEMYMQTEAGMERFVIKEVRTDSFILDFNHPFAGQDLIFDIEIKDVKKTPVVKETEPPFQIPSPETIPGQE